MHKLKQILSQLSPDSGSILHVENPKSIGLRSESHKIKENNLNLHD